MPEGFAPALRLREGARLVGGAATEGAVLEIDGVGPVQLNDAAAALLQLCDGAHTAVQVVGQVTRGATDRARQDAMEFLAAAMAMGWVEEVRDDPE